MSSSVFTTHNSSLWRGQLPGVRSRPIASSSSNLSFKIANTDLSAKLQALESPEILKKESRKSLHFWIIAESVQNVCTYFLFSRVAFLASHPSISHLTSMQDFPCSPLFWRMLTETMLPWHFSETWAEFVRPVNLVVELKLKRHQGGVRFCPDNHPCMEMLSKPTLQSGCKHERHNL